VFHYSWDFNVRFPLEGERTDYRLSVIRGVRGKIGEEAGLRRIFSLLRASPPDENQDIGIDEDEKEFEDMKESDEPVIEEIPEIIEETTTEPMEEEVPLETEAPAIEEEPIDVVDEVIEEPEPEPIIEEVTEEQKVIEPEPENKYRMEFEPETPVFSDGSEDVVVNGKLFGFLPQDELHIVVEKSTSGDNGWIRWTERNVSLNGERTLAFV